MKKTEPAAGGGNILSSITSESVGPGGGGGSVWAGFNAEPQNGFTQHWHVKDRPQTAWLKLTIRCYLSYSHWLLYFANGLMSADSVSNDYTYGFFFKPGPKEIPHIFCHFLEQERGSPKAKPE